MKTDRQSSIERTELCRLIQHMTVAMMTTANKEGGLCCRPMSPLLLDAYGDLWFYTDIRSEKIKHRDAINLSFIDPSRAVYVSLSGHGILHNERAYIDRLWTPFAKPWFAEGRDSANLVLLKFVTQSAEYWSSAQSSMVAIVSEPEATLNAFSDSSRQSASA